MDQVSGQRGRALRSTTAQAPQKTKTAIEHMGTITTFVLMLAVIFGLAMGCYELFKVVTG